MTDLFLRYAAVSLTCSAVLLPLLLLQGRLERKVAGRSLYVLFLLLALRLILPVQLELPQGQVTVEVPRYQIGRVVAAAPEGAAGTAGGESDVPQAGRTEGETAPAAPAAPAPLSLSLPQVLSLVWLAGGGVSLAALLVPYGLLRRKLLRESREAEPEVLALAARVGEDLGLRRLPQIRRTAGRGPMMLGVLRPVILLPQGEEEGEELALILRHELTHYRRRDVLYKSVMTLACVLHWFNPLVWLMSRGAGRNVELCCDDQVVRSMDAGGRCRYGGMLLRAAEGRPVPLSTCFAAGKGQLRRRIANLFAPKKNSAALVAGVTALALVAGSLVACTTQSLSAGTPREALEALAGSVTHMEEGFAFTIPQGYGGYSWDIHIAGRAEGPGGAMSIHYLEDAVWTPGENYLIECDPDTLLSLELEATVTDGGGASESRAIALVAERDPQTTASYLSFLAELCPDEAACSVLLADLTHDGEEELLVLRLLDRGDRAMDLRGTPDLLDWVYAELSVYTSAEGGVERLWQGQVSTSQAGWGSYSLYTAEDGGEYLLWYSDHAGQGMATPSYTLFSMDQQGEVQTAEEGWVTYVTDAALPNGPEALSTQREVDAFQTRLGELEDRSNLLIRYEGSALSYFDAPPAEIFAGAASFDLKVVGQGTAYWQDLLSRPQYAVFLTHTYDSPAAIDPNQALYNGSPWSAWNEADLTAAEREELSGQWPEMAFELDVIRVTAAEADAFLGQMAGVTLAGLDTSLEWTYLPSTDSYYTAHGDTNMVTPLVEKVESGEGETAVSYSIQGMGEFRLTLRLVNGFWQVYANEAL